MLNWKGGDFMGLMLNKIKILIKIIGIFSLAALFLYGAHPESVYSEEKTMAKVEKTDDQWRKELTSDQYRILRKKGTEAPFTGKYAHSKGKGVYRCAACGAELFSSETKFDSGSGWPSFWQPLKKENIGYETDRSFFMNRTEVHCAVCGGHMGHVFDDGPKPTGKRYCINSASLKFDGKEEEKNAPEAGSDTSTFEKATFGAGCFWGVEEHFRKMKGVKATRVGYTGGHKKNASYEEVCHGKTGHAEAVEITYDPKEISYDELLQAFWAKHNPTTKNQQGPDYGEQYRSAIFYHSSEQQKAAEASLLKLEKSRKWKNPIVTEIVPASDFWQAEDYHQQYLAKKGKKFCGF